MASPPMPSGSRLVASRCTCGQLPQDGLGGLGAAADQVLAVVEHDQQVLRGQGIEQGLQGRPARLGGDPQRLTDGRGHGVLVGDRGQLHQPDPVTGPVQQLGGHLQAQPGLAAPPGPGQRDQARGCHQGPDLGQLPVTADERRQLGRQIVRQRRMAQRAQRRELAPGGPPPAAGKSAPGGPGPSAGAPPDPEATRPAGERHAPARPPSPRAGPGPRSRPRPPGQRGAHPGPPGPRPSWDASPVCTPIRTRTCSPPGHACAARACCISSTAATHALGEENTAKNASPGYRPPCRHGRQAPTG